jgi:hypothetical protein
MADLLLRLSKSEGGHTNTRLTNWDTSFDSLVKTLSVPAVGAKDGPYFVRGPASEGRNREDANIAVASVVILDGDRRIIPETGEIVEGAPPPALVHELLAGLDIQHIIYTSHSHGTKGDRYRVVAIPNRQLLDPMELRACVDWLIRQLQDAGVWLTSVNENYVWSQPWYFPRIRATDAPFEKYVHDGGEALEVSKCVSWASANRSDDDTISAADGQASVPNPDSPIGKYNSEHGSPEAMLMFLVRHGYVLKGQTRINDEAAYRLLAPGSSTNQPGVVLFKSLRGPWRVYSHHGEHDPLSHKAEDAFGLLTALEFNGDQEAALESIGIFKRKITHQEVTAADINTEAGRHLVNAYRRQLQKGFDAQHGMLMIEGKAVVVSREVNGNTDYVVTNFAAKESVATYHANIKLPSVVEQPPGQYRLNWGATVFMDWLNNYYRRSYPQPVFSPQPNVVATTEMPPSGQPYNLFIGTAFPPLKGDCSLILTHIREVWCAGSDVAYQYVIEWLARMVQKPGAQGQTVIILRSGEGTGKNIIIDILDRYFGAHSVMLTKPEDLAGFNDHLGLSVFVFLNEALWGGNKSVEGTMKSTITDDVLLVERKYLPKFKTRNCTHIMAATNNDWAVPVGIDDRRFLILDASESRKSDFGYFSTLAAHIKSGGQEAFIHHLLHEVDIRSFDVRAIPELNSATKLDHKVRTMDSITRWWVDVLTDGGFSVTTQGVNAFGLPRIGKDFIEWIEDQPLSITNDDFYQSYLDATRSSHKEAKHSVTKKVGELLGKPLEQTRPRQPESGRTRKHVLPTLRDARATFEVKLQQRGPWHDMRGEEECSF